MQSYPQEHPCTLIDSFRYRKPRVVEPALLAPVGVETHSGSGSQRDLVSQSASLLTLEDGLVLATGVSSDEQLKKLLIKGTLCKRASPLATKSIQKAGSIKTKKLPLHVSWSWLMELLRFQCQNMWALAASLHWVLLITYWFIRTQSIHSFCSFNQSVLRKTSFILQHWLFLSLDRTMPSAKQHWDTDNTMVHLILAYTQKLYRCKPAVRTSKQ